MPTILDNLTPSDILKATKLAILPLQRNYRLKHAAYYAKKEIGLLEDEMVNYSFFLNGNEPRISIDKEFKCTDTKFNLVATGGLTALRIIKELIDWEKLEISAKTPTPKLFIVDYSFEAKKAWIFIKKIFANIERYEDINSRLDISSFIPYAPERYYDFGTNNPEQVCKVTIKCIYKIIEQGNAIQYNFLRNVVLQATLISNDWRSEFTHQPLAKHLKGQVNYVYSSNIIECIQRFKDSRFTTYESKMISINLITDICNYEPVLSIYARTSRTYFSSIGDGFHPTSHLFISGADPKNHWHQLSDPNFAPLTKNDYLEYVQLNSTDRSDITQRKKSRTHTTSFIS